MNSCKSHLRNPVMRACLRAMLYPWHRRQREAWELAAAIDVESLLLYVRSSRSRRPRKREYLRSIWTPEGGRYTELRS